MPVILVTAAAPALRDAQKNRGSILLEEATVTDVRTFPGDQFVLRIKAARLAARATPGSFVHVQCSEAIPMRRPLSIMRASAQEGWIEVLFKIVGEGLRDLGSKRPGDTLSVLGPIGIGFRPDETRRRPLLIGGGVGIPPMIFLAERLKDDSDHWRPLVIMGSEIPFPFEQTQSSLATPWLPSAVSMTMPLLEDWKIPARLASLQGYDGCFEGYVTDLARTWLESLTSDELAEVEIFSCGPTLMLKAVAALAQSFGLPCQVSLEEFMACGVGGCAGCTVLVQTPTGPAMKRVCVDGPVFDAAAVFKAP